MLKNGADPNIKSFSGITALVHAAYNRSMQMVVNLLEHGADPNLKGLNNLTATMIAMENKDVAMLEMLLNYGASLETQDNPYYSSHPSIRIVVNKHMESQPGFIDLPKVTNMKADKDLAAHPNHYHNYQCHDGDQALMTFKNDIGYYELVCAPIVMHDEL